jgi:molybdopterin converting factor small subunit
MKAPMATGPITVRLFARYAELLGAERIEVPSEGIRTVRDLLAHVRSLPGGALIGNTALVAVNRVQARADDRIDPSDEVALLPPLAGG